MRLIDFLKYPERSTGAVFYLCLVVTLVAYWPGLHGSFLLDDLPNIGALDDHPYLDTRDRLIAFVLSEHSGPLGRPLSKLSFLINDFAWPSDPEPFLYTNILMHLLNGCLVFWLFSVITEKAGLLNRRESLAVSVLAAAIWMLHPLNVSTVLYVVQRMTELASLFMLIGLICYVKGRDHLGTARAKGYALMSAGMGAGLLFGVFSKETAATLPLYVLVLEHTILGSSPPNLSRRPSPYWTTIFVYLPLSGVIGWHLLRLDSLLAGYSPRPFSPVERLLTEPRILIDYLLNIVFPKRAGTGLFHEDFVVSSSLLEPTSTVVAIAILSAALVAAIMLRKKWPVLAFSVLWFLAGHVFEAGVMPLELYFEHRNYLPMLGPVFGLACFFIWMIRIRLKIPGATAALLFVALAGVATWQNTTLWGNPALLGEVWAAEHPSSARAQQFAANQWSTRGRAERAKKHITRLLELTPTATSAHLALIQLNCVLREPVRQSDVDNLVPYLAGGVHDKVVALTFHRIVALKQQGHCPGLTYQNIDTMIAAVLDNENFRAGRLRKNLHVVRGQLAVNQRDFDKAVDSLSAAFNEFPDMNTAVHLATVLASGGLYDQALEILNDPKINNDSPLLLRLDSRERILAKLKERIRQARDRKENSGRGL